LKGCHEALQGCLSGEALRQRVNLQSTPLDSVVKATAFATSAQRSNVNIEYLKHHLHYINHMREIAVKANTKAVAHTVATLNSLGTDALVDVTTGEDLPVVPSAGLAEGDMLGVTLPAEPVETGGPVADDVAGGAVPDIVSTAGRVDCDGIATVLNNAPEPVTGTVASGPIVKGTEKMAHISATALKVSRTVHG